jgi:hypothetical protein
VKREELNQMKIGESVFVIEGIIVPVVNERCINKNEFPPFDKMVGGQTIRSLSDGQLKHVYKTEKDAHYAAIDIIDDLKKPHEERLIELGE